MRIVLLFLVVAITLDGIPHLLEAQSESIQLTFSWSSAFVLAWLGLRVLKPHQPLLTLLLISLLTGLVYESLVWGFEITWIYSDVQTTWDQYLRVAILRATVHSALLAAAYLLETKVVTPVLKRLQKK